MGEDMSARQYRQFVSWEISPFCRKESQTWVCSGEIASATAGAQLSVASTAAADGAERLSGAKKVVLNSDGSI